MPSRPDADDPRLGDVPEGRILRAILSRTPAASHALIGPGDDAAVIATPSGSVVATTDTLVHGPDFRLAWSSGYDLGWKSAAVNLADVAAMGARPTALLVALAVPREMRLSFVERLADGFRDACAALAPGCAVVGGDLTVSDTLTVAVTALGDLEGRAAVTRSGARPGDVVAVAGELGHAARGLAVLFGRFRDGDVPVPVDPGALAAGESEAVKAQLRPSPPIGLGAVAATAGATAMMDISDGLALDARRMAAASGVTIALDSALLGADPARALAGGEDHALLATFPEALLPPAFRAIGRVRAAGDEDLLCDEQPVDLSGWDPYRDWDSAAG
ncbi:MULTISPECIES: thiamine-phosphate kinase [unclassified Microbacterium]|uniref:thiamine-phosphate kinase n=1 Tax=unclassified Microbacterium TaxID=2609290 RepID=UPI000DE566A5|nr:MULTISPECIES: thiamine-phosphate kinase [unclassified Microbacterium]NYF28144.1 thiamine-monophosphate kinase [Microbacterium sp. JAI119]RBO70627.1 thiamine-phosphate kinase [Microbacterium sp. H6]